jgi:hypothetical protein
MAAGDITDALVDELGIRLEDPAEAVFTEAVKLLALNRGQIQVCHYLNNAYLTELEAVESDLTISGGSYSIASLDTSNGALKGSEGILAVGFDLDDSGTYTFATEVDIRNIKRTENTYLADALTNYLYYIFSNTIYCLWGGTAKASADGQIYYLSKPASMTTAVDPEINSGLHEIMLLFAEAICWAMDAKIDRRTKALESALSQCQKLNEKYTPATNIGTKGRIEIGNK